MFHSSLPWQAGKQNKVVTVLIWESDNFKMRLVKQETRTLQGLGLLIVFKKKNLGEFDTEKVHKVHK